MTHESPTAAPVLITRAEYHADWHAYIDDPARGPLGSQGSPRQTAGPCRRMGGS
ncbi:hypothetical protein ABT115_15800 [Streptomyces sp. NPDC001832]|uniref:hypothetical protein n=1 Tax=Streptomyces sp. NPDC001832 TaxID=3154527 RepID=UPI00332F8C15